MFSARSLDNYDPDLATGQQRTLEKTLLSAFVNNSDDNQKGQQLFAQLPLKNQDSIKPMKTRGNRSSLAQTIQKDKRDYVKISNQQKAQLIYKVFHQNRKINEAAKECQLKYASAKTIVFAYRNRKTQYLNQDNFTYKTAAVKVLDQSATQTNSSSRFEVICLFGGKPRSSNFKKTESNSINVNTKVSFE